MSDSQPIPAAKHREPRSTEAATSMLERFATLDGQRADIEGKRNADIAVINAGYDQQLVPIVAELEQIEAKIEPWWAKAKAALLTGKRKSIELGGCMIGSRAGKTKLEISGAEDALIKALDKLRWGKAFVRRNPTLDKPALLKAVDGPKKGDLGALGVTAKAGEDAFFVHRAAQAGTIGSDAA